MRKERVPSKPDRKGEPSEDLNGYKSNIMACCSDTQQDEDRQLGGLGESLCLRENQKETAAMITRAKAGGEVKKPACDREMQAKRQKKGPWTLSSGWNSDVRVLG